MAEQACPKCKGGRLKPESLAVFVGNKTIADVTKYSVQEVQEFFSNVELTEKQQSSFNFKRNSGARWVLSERWFRLFNVKSCGWYVIRW